VHAAGGTEDKSDKGVSVAATESYFGRIQKWSRGEREIEHEAPGFNVSGASDQAEWIKKCMYSLEEVSSTLTEERIAAQAEENRISVEVAMQIAERCNKASELMRKVSSAHEGYSRKRKELNE
jgi:hypothetical protein